MKLLFTRKAILGWLMVLTYFPWRWLWGAVELAGDIDFLLSLGKKFPEMRDFVIDFGWIPLTVFGFLWLGLVAAKAMPKKRSPTPRTATAMFSVAALFLLYGAFTLGRAFPSVGSVLEFVEPIEKWGIQGLYLVNELKLDQVVRYSDEYDVGVMCRVATPGVPFGQDKFLIRSNKYPINSDVNIQIRITSQFADRVCNISNYIECAAALIPKNNQRIQVFKSINAFQFNRVPFCAEVPQLLQK